MIGMVQQTNVGCILCTDIVIIRCVQRTLRIQREDPEQSNLSYAFSGYQLKLGHNSFPNVFGNAVSKIYFAKLIRGINSATRVQTMLAETVQGWYKKERDRGRAEGKEEGRAEGREEGLQEGKVEGRMEGKAEGLIFMLETRFEPLSAQQKKQIFSLADYEIMRAMECLFQATSLDDIFAVVKS